MLQLLSYVAETEHARIRQRQREGIEAARHRGAQFGRPPIPRGNAYAACREAFPSGSLSAREAGRRLGISHTTFLRWVRS